EDFRKARDVKDIFFRVERRQLPAKLRQRIDDLGRRATHPRIEKGEDPGGTTADDGDVFDFHWNKDTAGWYKHTAGRSLALADDRFAVGRFGASPLAVRLKPTSRSSHTYSKRFSATRPSGSAATGHQRAPASGLPEPSIHFPSNEDLYKNRRLGGHWSL